MPTKRRRRSRQQRNLWPKAVRDYLWSGEGDEEPYELLISSRRCSDLRMQLGRPDLSELEAAWIDLRDELIRECVRDWPGTRPAGWWWYDAPKDKPQRPRESDARYLKRIGALLPGELD